MAGKCSFWYAPTGGTADGAVLGCEHVSAGSAIDSTVINPWHVSAGQPERSLGERSYRQVFWRPVFAVGCWYWRGNRISSDHAAEVFGRVFEELSVLVGDARDHPDGSRRRPTSDSGQDRIWLSLFAIGLSPRWVHALLSYLRLRVRRSGWRCPRAAWRLALPFRLSGSPDSSVRFVSTAISCVLLGSGCAGHYVRYGV